MWMLSSFGGKVIDYCIGLFINQGLCCCRYAGCTERVPSLRQKRFEHNMPQKAIFTHIRAFFALKYDSIPAAKKRPTARKFHLFKVRSSFGGQIFCQDEAKSAGILCVFRAFLTIYWQKRCRQNHIGFESLLPKNKQNISNDTLAKIWCQNHIGFKSLLPENKQKGLP